jgi:DNA-binding winged helix-turn-helix (wHTH) protein
MRVAFDDFTVDSERREVCRGGEALHITPKAMDLLALLIERRPRVVSREQLLDELWPDVIVAPANLKNLVSELRRAFDDHERSGRFIRNVHGRGYAFTSQAVEIPEDQPDPATRIVAVVHEGRRFVLRPGANLVGRAVDCHVTLDDETVSRHHVCILVTPEAVTIEDLQSKNGTCVNGVRVGEVTSLTDGDRITLGTVHLTVHICQRVDSTKSTPAGEAPRL